MLEVRPFEGSQVYQLPFECDLSSDRITIKVGILPTEPDNKVGYPSDSCQVCSFPSTLTNSTFPVSKLIKTCSNEDACESAHGCARRFTLRYGRPVQLQFPAFPITGVGIEQFQWIEQALHQHLLKSVPLCNRACKQ